MGARPDAYRDDVPALRGYLLLILAGFALLTLRLIQLQVIAGGHHRLASLDNIIQTVDTPAPRGDIYDRCGRPLAKNVNVFSLLYLPPPDLSKYILDASTERLFATATEAQGTALAGLDGNDWSRLRREGRRVLQAIAARQQNATAPSENAPISQLEPGAARGTFGEWLGSLSLQQLQWVCSAQLRPGEIREDIRQYIHTTGHQPYLHRTSGQALSEIVRLAAYLGVPYEELMRRVDQESRRVYGYQPILLVDELTRDQVVEIAENPALSQGVLIEQYGFKRAYPLGDLAAHVIGYTGVLSEKDLEAFKDVGYGPQEMVGKEGVERSFEQLLHGTPGWRDIEVDRNRVFRKIVREVKPTKGTDLYLTLDTQIQAQAQRVLGGRPGAVIVASLEEGREGDILALASSPSYDPARFGDRGYYAGLLSNSQRPLLNRAYRHAFPPGSTFKIVTATAALQTGSRTPGTSFYCPGYKEIGNRRFYCHQRSGHGTVTFLEAIAQSCDVAFYQIGLGLDSPPKTLKRFAEYFGFGSPLGIELPNEVAGKVPDAAWKAEHYQKLGYGSIPWYAGDTANFAIGQGYLTATPLQVLWSAVLVATEGKRYRPRLLGAKTVEGRVVPTQREAPSMTQLNPKALATVREGMRLAVTSGTCRMLGLAGMAVCAKSGTAESDRKGELPHSWVTGFYPMSSPRYAFVVFFEHGGASSEAAIPAARRLLAFLRSYHPPAPAD